MSGAMQGRFNAITLIRWFFALSLVCFHACVVANHPFLLPVKGHAIVSLFFVISGMLAYEGYPDGGGAKRFYLRRIRRIFPPYAAVVIACAAGLAALSALPPGQYLASPETYAYLAANLGFMNFLAPQLPGVFCDNAITAVNSSLWTMKVELMFYAVVPAIMWLVRRWGASRAIVSLYLLSVAYNIVLVSLCHESGMEKFDIVRRQLPGQLMYFAAGMAVVELRAAILRHRLPMAVAATALWIVCDRFAPLRPVEPVAIAIAVTAVGYGFPRLSALSARIPNLTYEVYLLHFPIIQIVACLGLFASWGFAPAFALCVATTAALAFPLHKAFSAPPRAVAGR